MSDILKTVENETAKWVFANGSPLLPVFDDAFTSVDYRRLLERLYGFYRPYESAVGRVSGLQRILPDSLDRLKVPWLEADLLHLGSRQPDLSKLPVCCILPQLDSLANVFGALNVTEGSTLGGQVICRRLAQSLGVPPNKGASFFAGDGERTAGKWRIFKRALAALATAHNERVIVESALETLRVLWMWLSETRAESSRGPSDSTQRAVHPKRTVKDAKDEWGVRYVC